MNTQPNFFGVEIDTPLYKSLGADWATSQLAKLNEINSQIFLHKIEDHPRYEQLKDAPFIWRVVDARFSVEDTTMTRFRAFGYDGIPMAYATFGVIHGGMLVSIKPNGLKYPSWGDRYYIPVDNQIHTPNTGGYTVEVLDRNFPSEQFSFGMHKSGAQHQSLVISFRLFPFGV